MQGGASPEPAHAHSPALLVRLAQLRRRLRLQPGDLHHLPPLPSLPPPAPLEALVEHCAELGSVPAPKPAGDSFLHAVAAQLELADPESYVREQHSAVVAALEVCEPPGSPASAAEWARAMRHPDTPFDPLALLLWSLLNSQTVLVLGGGGAAGVQAQEVDACTGALSGVTMGRLEGGKWVGFVTAGADVSGEQHDEAPSRAKRARSSSPSGHGRRVVAAVCPADAALPLPVIARSEAELALAAKSKSLKARLAAVREERRACSPPDCFYLVRHPSSLENAAAAGHWARLEEPARSLVCSKGWHVVGFGRSRFVFNAYDNGIGRLRKSFFTPYVLRAVGYAPSWKNVLVWRERPSSAGGGGDAALAAVALETLIKALLSFSRRAHEPGRELRDHLIEKRLFCALDHPACADEHLSGWVDETFAMHPELWEALLALVGTSGSTEDDAREKLLGGGRLLRCDVTALRDALLPEDVRATHERLHGAWQKPRSADAPQYDSDEED
jgi:hypothetical protein